MVPLFIILSSPVADALSLLSWENCLCGYHCWQIHHKRDRAHITCRDLLRTLDGLQLRYTSRRANSCADWLAKSARIFAVDGYWDCNFPPFLSSLLSDDLQGLCIL